MVRPIDDGSHINVAELESVLKGISLAVSWKMSDIWVMTDSASVFNWVKSIVDKDRKAKVRGLSEVLIRRRLQLIQDILAECDIKLSISLVPSCENRADELTRVPSSWLKRPKNILLCNVAISVSDEISRIHSLHHFGVDRTFYFVKNALPNLSIC